MEPPAAAAPGHARPRAVLPPRCGASSSDQAVHSPSGTLAEYLASTRVTEHLERSIGLLLETKPEDPMEFLAEYFGEVLHKPGLVVSAHNLVRHGSVLSETFADGVARAYLGFQKRAAARTDDDAVVSVAEFAQILRLLCGKLPTFVQSRVVQELCDTRRTDVSWETFRDGILVARVVAEFHRLATSRWKSRPADMEIFDGQHGTDYAEEYALRCSDLDVRVSCLREFYSRLLLDPRRGAVWGGHQPARPTVGVGGGPEPGGVRRLFTVVEGAVMAAADGNEPE